jgi:radical SAM superfamily enzyme
MKTKIRCQSCGMPLAKGFYGSEKNGDLSEDFCKFCYEKGDFREKSLTLEEMIQRSIDNMTHDLKLSSEQAHKLAHSVIPTLKRWTI